MENKIINTNFAFLQPIIKKAKTFFAFIKGEKANTDFRFLQPLSPSTKTDFRFLQGLPSVSTPIALTDVDIKLDGTSFTNNDLLLNSIKIMLNADDKSVVEFDLTRTHDKIDYTVDNVYRQISNHNTVAVYIKSNYIWTFKIAQIQATSADEKVHVIAKGDEYTRNTNLVQLDLPSLNSQLGLYDVLVNNVDIDNPYVNSLDENPEYYNGIKINLGETTQEHIYRSESFIYYTLDELEPDQNYTYFWYLEGENFVTGDSFFPAKYIGTSLSPVSSDTFDITGIRFKKQRNFSTLTVSEGYYYLGSAPYKEVSTNNGQYIPVFRWDDREDGLYQVISPHYNNIAWAKKFAANEFVKIKNINGSILPKTRVSLSITLDSFMYYNLKLLQRINVGNTTQSGIYKNSNGFPVSIKGISIDFGATPACVDITADNNYSQSEIAALDAALGAAPAEVSEIAYRLDAKYDLSKQDYIS